MGADKPAAGVHNDPSGGGSPLIPPPPLVASLEVVRFVSAAPGSGRPGSSWPARRELVDELREFERTGRALLAEVPMTPEYLRTLSRFAQLVYRVRRT